MQPDRKKRPVKTLLRILLPKSAETFLVGGNTIFSQPRVKIRNSLDLDYMEVQKGFRLMKWN